MGTHGLPAVGNGDRRVRFVRSARPAAGPRSRTASTRRRRPPPRAAWPASSCSSSTELKDDPRVAAWSSAPARNATPRGVRGPPDQAAFLATLPSAALRWAAASPERPRLSSAAGTGRAGGPDQATHRRGSTSAGVTLPSSSPASSSRRPGGRTPAPSSPRRTVHPARETGRGRPGWPRAGPRTRRGIPPPSTIAAGRSAHPPRYPSTLHDRRGPPPRVNGPPVRRPSARPIHALSSSCHSRRS